MSPANGHWLTHLPDRFDVAAAARALDFPRSPCRTTHRAWRRARGVRRRRPDARPPGRGRGAWHTRSPRRHQNRRQVVGLEVPSPATRRSATRPSHSGSSPIRVACSRSLLASITLKVTSRRRRSRTFGRDSLGTLSELDSAPLSISSGWRVSNRLSRRPPHRAARDSAAPARYLCGCPSVARFVSRGDARVLEEYRLAAWAAVGTQARVGRLPKRSSAARNAVASASIHPLAAQLRPDRIRPGRQLRRFEVTRAAARMQALGSLRLGDARSLRLHARAGRAAPRRQDSAAQPRCRLLAGRLAGRRAGTPRRQEDAPDIRADGQDGWTRTTRSPGAQGICSRRGSDSESSR